MTTRIRLALTVACSIFTLIFLLYYLFSTPYLHDVNRTAQVLGKGDVGRHYTQIKLKDSTRVFTAQISNEIVSQLKIGSVRTFEVNNSSYNNSGWSNLFVIMSILISMAMIVLCTVTLAELWQYY